MNLTPENKTFIDSRTHLQLLDRWRFSRAGDPWFQGETGEYWGKRMAELRDADRAQAVADSKLLGWGHD